jgi:hypothetical protein
MLAQCPECNALVSTFARACPGCGCEHAGKIAAQAPCKKCKSAMAFKGRERADSGVGHIVAAAVVSAGLFLWGFMSPVLYGSILIGLSGVVAMLGTVAQVAARSNIGPLIFQCVNPKCARHREVSAP